MKKENQITVFGGTGKVGSQVLQYLSNKGIKSRALTRNLSKSKNLPHVEWIEGDLEDEKSIIKTLEGSNKLFLNTGVGQNMIEQQCKIVDMAKEMGIEYIIKLSTPAAREHSKDPVGEWHWQIQEHLKISGLDWNVIQPQSFMQNWLGDFAQTIKSEKKIYSTAGDGKRAFTDTRDIGKVATTLFDNPSRWIDQIIPISGNELVSFYDVADAFSQALEEKITYVPQSQEEAKERLKKKGVPDFLINVTLVIEFNQKTGVAEKLLTDNVKQISGENPFTIYDFAKNYSLSFK